MRTRFALKILICLLAQSAIARSEILPFNSEVEKIKLSQILKAQTEDEISQILQKHQQHDVDVEACKLQIQYRYVPTHCYLAIQRAVENFHIQPERQEMLKLNAICEQNAQATSQTTLPKSEYLPRECAQSAATKIKINQYKKGHDI